VDGPALAWIIGDESASACDAALRAVAAPSVATPGLTTIAERENRNREARWSAWVSPRPNLAIEGDGSVRSSPTSVISKPPRLHPLAHAERHEGRGIGDDGADLLGGALARAEEAVDVAGFEIGQGVPSAAAFSP
jgi:hypothetical protein